jgi:hypothetical protein
VTLQEFTLTCLAVRILSFIALLLCIGLVADHRQMFEWASASFVACIGTFICIQTLGQADRDKGKYAEGRIGDTKFEKIAVVGSFWVPIILAAFAICSISYLSIDAARVSWILVVLAGNIGLSSSSLYQMKRKR